MRQDVPHNHLKSQHRYSLRCRQFVFRVQILRKLQVVTRYRNTLGNPAESKSSILQSPPRPNGFFKRSVEKQKGKRYLRRKEGSTVTEVRKRVHVVG